MEGKTGKVYVLAFFGFMMIKGNRLPTAFSLKGSLQASNFQTKIMLLYTLCRKYPLLLIRSELFIKQKVLSQTMSSDMKRCQVTCV